VGLWSLPRWQMSDTSPQAGVLSRARLLQLRRHSSQRPERSGLAGLLERVVYLLGIGLVEKKPVWGSEMRVMKRVG
jgi:hypothetical protein